jgi:antitoxin component of MazEF toxin-antitoxin module
MAIEVQIRRVGNSAGIILPKEFLETRHLKVGDRVVADLNKPFYADKVFGMFKGKRKLTGQQAKDLARSGWE